MDRCVFFDRDGVVNVSPGSGYLLTWEDFRFSPGIRAALRAAGDAGCRRILITNQQGVARGVMSASDLEDIHRRMQEALERDGLAFDDIYASTEPAGPGSRRKPSPAMLLEAAERWNLDLARSWMVGDDDRDILAGQRAGVSTIRLRCDQEETTEPDHAVDDLEALATLLRRVLASP